MQKNEEKMIEEQMEILNFIIEKLFQIRDGLLDDSSRTRAAYHLGYLLHFVQTEFNILKHEKFCEEEIDD